MNQQISDIYTKLRELDKQGAYGDFLKLLEELPADVKSIPRYAMQIGRIFLSQGRVDKAASAFREADLSNATAGEKLILLFEDCSLRLYKDGQIREALETASAAWSVRNLNNIDSADEAEAERILIRIILSAAGFQEVPAEKWQESSYRLPQISQSLLVAGRYEEALSAKLTWFEKVAAGIDGQAPLDELTTLALSVNCPQIAGKAWLKQAESVWKAGGDRIQVENLIDSAIKMFQEAQNTPGQIDAESLRARIEISDHGGSIARLERLLAEYRQIDYPSGEMLLLLDLAQISLEKGLYPKSAEYRDQIDQLARQTGLGFMRSICQLRSADSLIRASRYRDAIEVAEAAIEQSSTQYFVTAFQQLIATARALVGDTDAYFAAPKTENGNAGVGNEAADSLAAMMKANELLFGDSPNPEAAEQLLREWIPRDVGRGDIASAVWKREILAQILINHSQSSAESSASLSSLQQAESELEQAMAEAQVIGGLEGARRRGSIWQMLGQIYSVRSDNSGTELAWINALTEYESAGLSHEAANCHYIIGILLLNRSNQSPASYFAESERHLLAAYQYYLEADVRNMVADCLKMLARLYKNTAQQMIGPDQISFANQLIDAALLRLSEAEQIYDDIRHEYGFSGALAGQAGRQSLIEKSRQIFDDALHILTVDRPNPIEAWRWVQRAKARGLADMLAGTTPPAGIVAAIKDHPDGAALVDLEIDLSSRLATAAPAERIELRHQRKLLRQRMDADPLLTDYLEMRRGRPLDIDDTDTLFGSPGKQQSILCVDWFCSNGQIWMTAVRPGLPPITLSLGIDLATVSAFVQHNLSEQFFRDTLRESADLLRAMDVLIGPLVDLCQPEDLIVLSPTGLMNSLPLHALEVNGLPLLVRNPVVYTPSLGILRYCLGRSRGDHKLRTAAIFGDPEGDREVAATTTQWLAKLFSTTALIGNEVDRSSFLDQANNRDLIHFQGHARQIANDPLSSHLSLSDGNLTARDIFEICNLRAELVMLAACESGVSAISTGDEPLGLIPAILYAGAGAVVATLWRVNKDSSAELVRHFYNALAGSTGTYDKARALRHAALAIRARGGKYEQPYHWAPFVLHGDWR